MTVFFRLQGKGISLKEMQSHKTFIDVDPISGDEIHEDGVCASENANGYDGGSQWGGQWPAEGDEIVVFEGRHVKDIYDGAVAYPTRIVARFDVSEWDNKLADETAYNYEA